MGVSGDMDLGGRLERSIDQIGQALRNANWETTLQVQVSGRPGASTADVLLDRAEQAGRGGSPSWVGGDATGAGAPGGGGSAWFTGSGGAWESGGKAASQLLDPNNQAGLTAGMARLAEMLDRMTGGHGGGKRGGPGGGGGGRRGGGGAPREEWPEDEDGPGYVSPWTAFGLMRSPTGTIQSAAMQALAGENSQFKGLAGSALFSWLKGTNGGIQMGKALASPVGSTAYLSAAGSVAMGAGAVLGGAYGGWQINNRSADGALRDAMESGADYRMSRRLGTGFNFRDSAMNGDMQGRSDIIWPEVREFLSQLNVGLDRYSPRGTRNGVKDWAGEADRLAGQGEQMGLGAGETAGIVGASIRSGLLAPGDPKSRGYFNDPSDLLQKIHGAIQKGHEVGVGTHETLQVIAQLNQRMVEEGGMVTRPGFEFMAGLHQTVSGTGRADLRGQNSGRVTEFFTDTQRGDAARVRAMREFLTVDDRGRQVLSADGRAAASELLGDKAVESIRGAGFADADARIAEALVRRAPGMGRAQMAQVQRMRKAGLGADAIAYMGDKGDMDPVFLAAALDAADRGVSAVPAGAPDGGPAGATNARSRSMRGVGQVYTTETGREWETAENIHQLNADALKGFREAVNGADKALRNFGKSLNAPGIGGATGVAGVDTGFSIARWIYGFH